MEIILSYMCIERPNAHECLNTCVLNTQIASGTLLRVHIKGASSVACRGPKRGSMSEFSRNMKYCCIYLICLLCLHSYAGVDMGEHLRRVWVVQRLQSDFGGGGGEKNKESPLSIR